MKSHLMLIGLFALGFSSTAAMADISGGPVFNGGNTQLQVRCMVFNAGPGVATLGNKAITTGGTPVTLTFNSCGASLAAGKLCVIAVTPVAQVAHSCKFVTSGGELRGTIAVYGNGDQLRHSSDMR